MALSGTGALLVVDRGVRGRAWQAAGGTACEMLGTLAARHPRAGLSAHQGRSHHREPYGRPRGALPRGRHQAGVRHRHPPCPRSPDALSRPLTLPRPLTVSREGGAGRLCSHERRALREAQAADVLAYFSQTPATRTPTQPLTETPAVDPPANPGTT